MWKLIVGKSVQNHLLSFILICKKSTKLKTVVRIKLSVEALSSLSCSKSSENGSYLILEDIITFYTRNIPLKHKYKYIKKTRAGC